MATAPAAPQVGSPGCGGYRHGAVVAPSPAAPLVNVTPTRVLAVYAHPGDAEVGCGGTLARWAAAGAEVHLTVCCTGDKGSADADADADALAATRSHESSAAAAVLGALEQRGLGRPDGSLEDTPELRAELVGLVRAIRPEVVVCPDPTAVFFGRHYLNHRDHRVIGWSVLDAVAPAASNPHYFPECGPAHAVAAVWLSGTLEPDASVDIGAVVEVKAAALACHASQVGDTSEWLATVVRERAEEAGKAAGVPYAESFRRLLL